MSDDKIQNPGELRTGHTCQVVLIRPFAGQSKKKKKLEREEYEKELVS